MRTHFKLVSSFGNAPRTSPLTAVRHRAADTDAELVTATAYARTRSSLLVGTGTSTAPTFKVALVRDNGECPAERKPEGSGENVPANLPRGGSSVEGEKS